MITLRRNESREWRKGGLQFAGRSVVVGGLHSHGATTGSHAHRARGIHRCKSLGQLWLINQLCFIDIGGLQIAFRAFEILPRGLEED